MIVKSNIDNFLLTFCFRLKKLPFAPYIKHSIGFIVNYQEKTLTDKYSHFQYALTGLGGVYSIGH